MHAAERKRHDAAGRLARSYTAGNEFSMANRAMGETAFLLEKLGHRMSRV
jgi:hypothetical protein